ncbi:MAG: serine hydrolase [Flavobacteriales bacterium]|jgi:CubicO group peptidase (beta-lactamase class C family)|nr:serine hydrolase [Flavobacteriales bacterium]MBT4706093.1 serine hydrolase [Flavobacteriales bacterium]MBT5976777.1 serine hydrolase [Flavobacteriales bacterium]MBT6916622.1 serine hydrolase [Flavobacteriales bacterium]MBT6979424.1 serine hydrolase [Flavobacteriales bacterium]
MRTGLSILLMLLFTVPVIAQESDSTFSKYIENTVKKFDLPSLSVGVLKDGKVIYSKGFGKKTADAKLSPDKQTMYAIASLSKAFTAAAMGMLVDEGKVNWDDKVKDHLPWFEMNDTYVSENLTVEDLLCHRSGLITFDGDLLWYGSSYSREETVRRIRHREPTYGLREEFGYQNIMFMTAGEVIEAASGMSWDDFVKTRILNPLGMKRTTSSFQEFSTDLNIAKPTLKGKEILMLSYDNCGATAALSSSSEDMLRWAQFWLNGGVVNGDTLLQPSTIKRIWSVHTTLPVGKFDEKNGTHFKGYGMGWFVMDYEGRKVIHHGGGLPGYITKFVVVPEEKLAIIAMTNDMSSIPSMMMYSAIDWSMGKPYEQWAQTFYDFKTKGDKRELDMKNDRASTRNSEPMLLPLTDYVGTYRDDMYGDASVIMGKDGLLISLIPTKELFTGKMSPWDDHAFKFEHNDPFLTYGIANFDVDKDVVKGFKIDLPNYDFHFDKLDFKRVE